MKYPPKLSSSRSEKKTADETVEVKAAWGDGVHRIDRPHVVPASESAIGGIDHDEQGRARWKWKTDVAESGDPTDKTFNFLKALDSNLEIERSQKVRVLEPSEEGSESLRYGPLEKAEVDQRFIKGQTWASKCCSGYSLA